jgi:glycogen(starch) synthase
VLSPPRSGAVRPLRILLAPSAYYPHVGGIEETTRQLARHYRQGGHHVSVLTNRWPHGVPPREDLDGVGVTRLTFPLPASGLRDVARFLVMALPAAATFMRHVRAERPDVLHVIGAGPQSVYAALLHRYLGTRVVFTGQGELEFDAQRVFERSLMLRLGLHRMLKTADAVTACSDYVLRGLQTFGEMSAEGVVIPNGVDPGDFDVPPRRNDDLGRYVLAVGRLVPQKGFDVLLDAFTSKSLNRLTLVIAGDGMERQRLETKADDLGIRDHVRFLGSVDRQGVARLLGGAFLFALPSRGEPFGIALLEAMAAGVPSVATAAGGIPEFAYDGENALLVPPNDAGALSAALVRLSSDRLLRQRLSTAGRLTASAITWTSIANQYQRVYRRTIA